MIQIRKIVIVFITVIEMALFSGIYMGFNSLIPVLKNDGVFSQFCENPQNNATVSCAAQETLFGRAFASWVIVHSVMSFVLGILLDKFGLQVVKVICSICIFGGTLCLVFTPKLNWLFFIAGSLLTISAQGLNMTNISISILFSGKRNMFVSVVTSLNDISAIVMSVLKYITDLGVPFWLAVTIYGSVGSSLLLVSLFLFKSRPENMLPKKNLKEDSRLNEEALEQIEMDNIEIKSGSDNEITKQENVNECAVSNESHLSISNVERTKEIYYKTIEERFPTLKKCMLSPEYLIQLFYFSLLRFRFLFYLAQLSSQLKYLFPTQPEVVDHLLSFSNLFFIASLFISPLSGILLDKYQRYTFQYLSKDQSISARTIYKTINACFFPHISICCLAILTASSLFFISNQYSFYMVFVCITMTRSLLYSLTAAYFLSAFPKKYFGTLNGSVYFISGFLNLLQQFIIQYASPNSYPNLVNYILLGSCVAALVYPLYLKFKK